MTYLECHYLMSIISRILYASFGGERFPKFSSVNDIVTKYMEKQFQPNDASCVDVSKAQELFQETVKHVVNVCRKQHPSIQNFVLLIDEAKAPFDEYGLSSKYIGGIVSQVSILTLCSV